jgi:chitin synthase
MRGQADRRQWAIYKNKVYDLSDYLYTVQYYSSSSGTDLPNYSFLNDDVTGLFQQSAGQDITKQMDTALAKLSSEDAANQLTCLDNAFYVGETDFRLTARCTVQNWLLLAFSIILMTTILSKCTSSPAPFLKCANAQSWQHYSSAQRDIPRHSINS